MWYAMAPAVSFGIFAGGTIYWVARFWLLPKWQNYELVPTQKELSDGTRVTRYEKVPRGI